MERRSSSRHDAACGPPLWELHFQNDEHVSVFAVAWFLIEHLGCTGDLAFHLIEDVEAWGQALVGCEEESECRRLAALAHEAGIPCSIQPLSP